MGKFPVRISRTRRERARAKNKAWLRSGRRQKPRQSRVRSLRKLSRKSSLFSTSFLLRFRDSLSSWDEMQTCCDGTCLLATRVKVIACWWWCCIISKPISEAKVLVLLTHNLPYLCKKRNICKTLNTRKSLRLRDRCDNRGEEIIILLTKVKSDEEFLIGNHNRNRFKTMEQ